MIQIYKKDEPVIGLDGVARTWKTITDSYLNHIKPILSKKIDSELKKIDSELKKIDSHTGKGFKNLKCILNSFKTNMQDILLNNPACTNLKKEEIFSPDLSNLLETALDGKKKYEDIDSDKLLNFVNEQKRDKADGERFAKNLKTQDFYEKTKRERFPNYAKSAYSELVNETDDISSDNEDLKYLVSLFNERNTVSSRLLKILDYTSFRKDYGYEFVNMLGIKACPYCNSQFIFTVDKINNASCAIKKSKILSKKHNFVII